MVHSDARLDRCAELCWLREGQGGWGVAGGLFFLSPFLLFPQSQPLLNLPAIVLPLLQLQLVPHLPQHRLHLFNPLNILQILPSPLFQPLILLLHQNMQLPHLHLHAVNPLLLLLLFFGDLLCKLGQLLTQFRQLLLVVENDLCELVVAAI